ncbi:MAG: hypothetical protein AB7F86_11005 [Bdellovibrionales bacterium]
MYVDAYAIIVQQDGDGGDSLQREGMYAFGKWLRYQESSNTLIIVEPPERQDSSKILDKFEVEPGVYVRHPDPEKWYSNPDTTSRDQLVPVIAYCGAYQDYPRLWRLFKRVMARGFFSQNTVRAGDNIRGRKIPDTFLAHLDLFIRAGGYWTAPLYPVLFVTDTIDLIGTLLNQVPIHWENTARRFRWVEPRDVDDNNVVIGHLMAMAFKPTPISWLNRQIYSWTRRMNNGNFVRGESNPVMGAMVWYHRKEHRGNPEMAELYRPLILKYFSPQDDVRRAKLEINLAISRWSNHLLTTSL